PVAKTSSTGATDLSARGSGTCRGACGQASTPKRVLGGWQHRGTLTGNTFFPGILDRSLGKSGFSSQQTKQDRDANQPANLWEPADETHDFGTRGIFSYRSKNTSLQFFASRYRGTLFTTAVLGAGTAVLT